MITYLYGIIAAISALVLWLLFFRKKLRKESKKEQPLQLDSVKLNSVIYSNIEIIKTYAEIVYTYRHDNALLEKKLYKEITSKIIGQINIVYLRDIMDFRYGDCRVRLLSQNPNLTEGDIDICYMIIAGLDNHQMSVMLKLNDVNSLYVKKNRLKSRLGISATEKLDQYIIKYVKDSIT